jgi:hypothetical protein
MFKTSQFESISRKKLREPLGPFFQTPPHFLDTDCTTFKTHSNEYILILLEIIQLSFFYILIIIKYSSYDRISKSQKNQHFIK